jgi:hypothetical protein
MEACRFGRIWKRSGLGLRDSCEGGDWGLQRESHSKWIREMQISPTFCRRETKQFASSHIHFNIKLLCIVDFRLDAGSSKAMQLLP